MSAIDETPVPADKLAYTIKEAAHALSIGRSTVYRLLKGGELASVSIGARRLILRQDLDDFLRGRRETADRKVA